MREAIGTQSIFKAIIIFTFLFAGFIAVAITYNKAYKLKNEALAILEKYEGVSSKSLKIVNNYLSNSGYIAKQSCSGYKYGVSDLNGDKYEPTVNNKNYFYCIDPYIKNGQVFYKIKLFSRFNLPFVGDLLYFNITGETKGIKIYSSANQLTS